MRNCEGPLWKESFPEEMHSTEGNHTGTLCEELQPLGRIQVGEFSEVLYPGAEEELEERGADMKNYEVVKIPFPITLDCSGGGGREFGNDVEPEKKERVG